MRFLLYDRVTSLEKGNRIAGVKALSASEAFLEKHFTRAALVPGTLLIEAMAQLFGWLVIYSHDFRRASVLSLLGDVRVPPKLKPGVTLEIEAHLVTNTERDALGRAVIFARGEEIARAERMIFSNFPTPDPARLRNRFLYYGGIDNLEQLERESLTAAS